jgi:geranylgeranyl diphosphate synthase type I
MDVEKFLRKKKPEIEAILEKAVPRRVTENYLEWLVGKASYEYDPEAVQKGVSEPVWNFLDRGGKRWRPSLFLLTVEALGKDPEKFKDYAAIVELIHNGTIMVDDVEDDARMRRGKPPLHKLYGVDTAVNTGNLLYFLPFALLRGKKFRNKTLVRAYEAYVDEMVKLSLGQNMDIWWHKGGSVPTERQYLQMCAFKTGTLARFSARLAVILCEGSEEQEKRIGRMLEAVGVAFQIQDDILDLTAKDRERFGKSFGNDITEGKRTLAIIHALSGLKGKERCRLLGILNSHTRNGKELEEAINLVKKAGGIEYAKDFARKLASEVWEDCKGVIPDGAPKDALASFVRYLVERDI